MLLPAVKRMGVLMHEMVARARRPPAAPPPQAAEMAALGKRLGVVGPILNLLLIVILFLMVWKPGVCRPRAIARSRRTMTPCIPWSAASTTRSSAS